jgi:TonB-linked SusC/RagA family outer membrane protein
MKKRIYLLLFGLLLLCGQSLMAQKVTGVVTSDEDGQGIPGVSVFIKGTSTATVTDIDGKFEIAAKNGETLLVTLIGYTQQEISVTQAVVNVVLKSGDQQLGEVVVTALGLKEEQRKLNYNVQTVKGEDLVETNRDNFLEALQGRVSGLTVTTTGGTAGSSTLIQLRGVSSIGGNNQPLIVVDGLPIDNSTFGQGGLVSDQPNRQNDYSSRVSDINPNDIESVSILKGPEAAALYGSQGSSGAILITTKRAAKGRGKINYSNTFGFDEVYRVPKTQSQFIRGFNGVFDPNAVSYFGPALPDTMSRYDNVNNFFQKGLRQVHNISMESGSDKLSYLLSGTFNKRENIIPNTGATSLNLRLTGNAKLLNNLEINSTIGFINSELQKPTMGDAGIVTNLYRWPFYDDITNYLNADGTRRKLQTTTLEFDNPFFNVQKIKNTDVTRRIFGNTGLTWKATEWLSFIGRFGTDYYNTQGNFFAHPEANVGLVARGSVENYGYNSRLFNGNFVGIIKKEFSESFGFSFTGGTSIDDKTSDITSVRGEKLYDPNFNSLNNTDPTTMRNKLTIRRNRLLGLFGKADFTFKDQLFLTVTGRNDWSSTLPEANRSYFYPSVSAGWEFTKLLKDVSWLSYGKLRVAFAKSGKDAPPFLISPALAPQTTTGGGFIYGFFGGNPNLKPEFVTSQEVGVDFRFFKSRVKFDVSYFENKRSDQIVTQRLSYGTGFIFGLLNGGSFGVKGIESQLAITAVKSKDFNWEVITNFTKSKTNVISLPADQNEYYNSDTWLLGNARASALLPLDQLQASFPTFNLSQNERGAGSATAIGGYSYLRSKTGEVMVSPSTGLPVINTNFLPIGDRQPDFNIGIVNNFKWKGLGLSFNLDIRKGGDVFNGNEFYFFRAGLSNKFLDRTTPYVFKGVVRDGKENSDAPTVNNIQVTPQTRSDFYTAFPESEFVERDINWFRVRDLSLSYKFPQAVLKRVRTLNALSVYVSVNDLFMATNYTGADPAVNGTTATSAGVGAWGFDFGKIGAPRSITFGLRTTLQ